jgi:hypothetical protein
MAKQQDCGDPSAMICKCKRTFFQLHPILLYQPRRLTCSHSIMLPRCTSTIRPSQCSHAFNQRSACRRPELNHARFPSASPSSSVVLPTATPSVSYPSFRCERCYTVLARSPL